MVNVVKWMSLMVGNSHVIIFVCEYVGAINCGTQRALLSLVVAQKRPVHGDGPKKKKKIFWGRDT